MTYRFIIEAWTNAPDEVQTALAKAIDRHAPLHHLQWDVSGHEMGAHVKPDDVGKSHDGDPWRFYVEIETSSPDWTRREIERAIRNYTPAAQLGLTVEPGHVLLGGEAASDDANDWLRGQRSQEHE